MMKKIKLMISAFILIFTYSGAFADNVNEMSYAEMKQKAIDFESSLSEKKRGELSRAYAPLFQVIFERCIGIARPSSFEIISYVNADGIMEKNWSQTSTDFAQCAVKLFDGAELYKINDKSFYAILEFNLSLK